MKHRRAKNSPTLHFSQRDFLPTITEGQPIDIGVISPSLKVSFPRVYHSSNTDGRHIQADTSQHHPNNFKPALEITRLGHMEEPPSPTLSLLSDLELLSPTCDPTETPPSDTLPTTEASSPALEDHHLQQLEWATAKILAQPERALAIYRRMRRENMITQVPFLDDLTRKHYEVGLSPDAICTREEHGRPGASQRSSRLDSLDGY